MYYELPLLPVALRQSFFLDLLRLCGIKQLQAPHAAGAMLSLPLRLLDGVEVPRHRAALSPSPRLLDGVKVDESHSPG